MNIRIFKAPDHLDDRVDFANMAEELIAQTFPSAGTLDQSRNVNKLNRGWNDFLRMGKLREDIKPRIRNDHDTQIRINRAERIIRCLRLSGPGYGIKEGGLA